MSSQTNKGNLCGGRNFELRISYCKSLTRFKCQREAEAREKRLPVEFVIVKMGGWQRWELRCSRPKQCMESISWTNDADDCAFWICRICSRRFVRFNAVEFSRCRRWKKRKYRNWCYPFYFKIPFLLRLNYLFFLLINFRGFKSLIVSSRFNYKFNFLRFIQLFFYLLSHSLTV